MHRGPTARRPPWGSPASPGWRLAILALTFGASIGSPELLTAQSSGGATTSAAARDTSTRPAQVALAAVARDEWDSWRPPMSTWFTGEIVDFDAQQLVLRETDGNTTMLPSERVEQVQFEWATAEASAAMQLKAERNYGRAKDAMVAAYPGLPRWQQRLMIAQLVDVLDALGQTRSAGVIFLNLSAASPPAMLYGSMPLCWDGREANATLKNSAAEWMSGKEPESKLLGASWLLAGPQSAEAERVLRQLAGSADGIVAQLAGLQLWRTIPPPQTTAELTRLFAVRDQLPEPLQLGPTEFLADRLTRTGQAELALGQWMRIATIHRDRYHRASRAMEAAIGLLRQQGKSEKAKRLEAWISEQEQVGGSPIDR